MKTLFNLAAIFATFAVCGCASVKTIQVDAIASPNAVCGKACAVVPANPKVSPNDLWFKETASVVAKALEMRGFSFVDDSAKADVILAVDSSLGSPENVAVERSDPPLPDPGFYGACRVPVRGRDGRICYVRAAMWYPSYPWPEPAREAVYHFAFYEKRLILTAYLNNGDKTSELPQLWSVVAVAHDESSDIRAYIPALAFAAARYAGKDTKGRVAVDIFGDDPDLCKIAPHASAESKSAEASNEKGAGKSVGVDGKYLIDDKR